MPSLYVTQPGSRVGLNNERLLIEKDDQKLLDIALRRLTNVVCFGRVHVTTSAMHELLERGIDFAFVDRKGQYRGRLAAPVSKNVYLRLAQYEAASNDEASLRLARVILLAKLGNSRNVLRKFQYNHPSPRMTEVIRKLEKLSQLVETAVHPSRLRGLEGTAARLYFSLFDEILRCPLRFEKRSAHPPANEVNALLSLTYTLVLNEFLSILESFGFDPFVGFFHTPGYGKPSLGIDLLEPYRGPLCDVFVFRLLNLQILTAEDFHGKSAQGPRLTKTGFATYLEHYEKRMSREFLHPQTGKKVTWRDCLRQDAESLRRNLLRKETLTVLETNV